MDSLIESLPQLPDSAEMKAWDEAAIKFGIPEIMLMENASEAIFSALCARYGDPAGKIIWLFMGGGNNGGDAAALARRLLDARARPCVFCRKPLSSLQGAALWHAELARKAGVPFKNLGPESGEPSFHIAALASCGEGPSLIIDGLLGTGFAGILRRPEAELIEDLNAFAVLASCPILAIDIPSGLNATDGKPQPVAIRADCTVTLVAAKPGLLYPDARSYTGQVICRPIGMPARAVSDLPARIRLLDGSALPSPPPAVANGYKNVYGHIFVIGGAGGHTGACSLACLAALREGAGLVTACAPNESLAQIRAGRPEIMGFPAGAGSDWTPSINSDLGQALTSASALVIGPGMGRTEAAASFLAAVLSLENRPPVVLDADGLFLLARNPALAAKLTDRDALTPHPGEAAMLLAKTSREVQAERLAALAGLCSLAKAAVVLKGASTLASRQNGPVLLCPYDIPLLSIGGAGDVLAGCLGAILGSRPYGNWSALAKAALAVITHAMAALSLAAKYPERGLVASQLADALPFARQFVKSCQKPHPGLIPWPQY